jgi:glucose/arabinose dehydrogenase
VKLGKDDLAVIVYGLMFIVSVSCGGSDSKSSVGPSTGLTTTMVASGLNRPTFVSSLPGNPEVLVVLEQYTGLIKLINGGAVIPRPFLNISDRVINTGDERGLLGLAFDPNYAVNGFFYVNYIDNSGNTVISRFQVTSDPDSANPSSEMMLLNVTQPYPNHNGGMLAFGPNDGYLYVGLGDGGSGGDPENRAQN